ncbi:MAG: DNA (cytosine-5-)-methyltransferase [Kiritimatiellaeota bacterium]|nr:DNA (cytosine-5-)-methyltransferase [Kiritimatiellota bacterium]
MKPNRGARGATRRKTYKTIDLFAGIGGIRRGYELAGVFENALSAEIDKYARATYKHVFGEDPFNDVTSAGFKTKVENTPYDVLLAGFPCQSFSRAGRQEGFRDKTRGTLFFDIADIIDRTRPKAFMLENVDNLLSHEKGATFKTILETLVKDLRYKVLGVRENTDGELSYDTKSFLRNTRNFGLPQNRPRIYIMGFDMRRYAAHEAWLDTKTLPEKRSAAPIYNDLNDLLELKADAEYYVADGYLSTLEKHRARHEGKGNGFGYMIVNAPGTKSPYSNALLATGGSGKERNLVFDPQKGVAGRVMSGKRTPLNDKGVRHMTPREWGKLQGFHNYGFMKNGVDKFSFPAGMSRAQQYKMFGNSVSIPVVEEMALFMKKILAKID